MSKAEKLRARFGAHINESMNASGAGATESAPPVPVESSATAMAGSQEGVSRFREASRIALERIMADPSQPRAEFSEDELARLAGSLMTRGQLQPIRVRWSPENGKYVILTGERRWRAAARAGINVMECVIESRELTPEEILQDQVVENCLREDLKPMEQARAFRRLMEAKGWSLRQIGQELHLAHGTVVKALALLDLPEAVQELVEQGAVKPATAYEIGKAGSDAEQVELAARVVSEGLTRDQVTSAVKERTAGASPLKRNTHEIRLEDGTRVTVSSPAADLGPSAIANALQQARKRVLAATKSENREEAA